MSNTNVKRESRGKAKERRTLIDVDKEPYGQSRRKRERQRERETKRGRETDWRNRE